MGPVDTDPVTVRRVRPDDWAATKTLRLQALLDTPIGFLTTYDDALGFPDSLWQERAQGASAGGQTATFLAVTGDHLVGTATGIADDGGAARSYVVAVFVDPRSRGNGLLGRLVDEIAHWSREHDRPELVLEVADANARAVRAYRRLGFAETGGSQPHPGYPGVRELEMARPA